MSWLSKKDIKFTCCSIVLSILTSYLINPFLILNIDYIVEFFSIIIGFLISSITLLYSSNIRVVLYKCKDKDYPNYWFKIVSYYRFAIFYFLFLVLFLIIRIDRLSEELYQQLYLAIIIEGFYWILKIVVNLFYLLNIEINSK